MLPVPFLISDEAAKWISERLIEAQEECERVDLAATLCLVLDYQCVDDNGRLFERHLSPFFRIGLYPRELALSNHFVEMDVFGRKLFIQPGALEELSGKILVAKTIEVGYPTPS